MIRVLEVPFEDREIVKRKGAKQNNKSKRWECSMENKDLYAKYKAITLEVPYDDRDKVKTLGAKWDSTKKMGCSKL